MTNKIEFTESAEKEIARVVSEKGPKIYFRISVQGGGCSGFKYSFSLTIKLIQMTTFFIKLLLIKAL